LLWSRDKAADGAKSRLGMDVFASLRATFVRAGNRRWVSMIRVKAESVGASLGSLAEKRPRVMIN